MIIRLHPYQYVYYNVFTGGPRGAAKRFTAMDYWGSSYREATAWLVQHLRERDGSAFAKRRYNVAVTDLWWCAREAFTPNFNLIRKSSLPGVDYAIVLALDNQEQTCPGETIFKVVRMGTTLSVVKQLRLNATHLAP